MVKEIIIIFLVRNSISKFHLPYCSKTKIVKVVPTISFQILVTHRGSKIKIPGNQYVNVETQYFDYLTFMKDEG